jgi:predicted ribosome quality control (RQC) complex YloA/Tae2 family protein
MSSPPPSAGSLNWKEIDLVLSELALAGSLIQEIHQPRHDRIVLHLFKSGAATMILVSLSSRLPRLHALTQKGANPGAPLRFASFLRAHIRGGRIESAEQLRSPTDPVQGERIVRLAVRRADEVKVLWIRLWGAAANALLTDESGTILDAMYRRPKRNEISGKKFDPRATGSGTAGGGAPGAVAAGSGAARAPAPERLPRSYDVRDLPGTGTFNERLEVLFAGTEGRGDRERAAAQAEAELEMSENKLLANLEKLRSRLSTYANLERFRELGDLLTSSLHLVRKGDRWIRVKDFFHDNAEVEIELRPDLTPAQNAEACYDRHRKARLGRGKVQEEIENLEATLVRVRAERAALAANPDPQSLERAATNAARARKPLHEADMPGLVFVSPPFRILVGRTAAENDDLLRTRVRGNDWWFHARDWPGAYVFVKAQPGKSLPLETMLDAATLAVHFSKGKTSGQGDVYYTQVKYLRRAKGARRGTVLPTQEKNLHVKLDPARIERLKTGGPVGGPAAELPGAAKATLPRRPEGADSRRPTR